jgi:hypothetical protein
MIGDRHTVAGEADKANVGRVGGLRRMREGRANATVVAVSTGLGLGLGEDSGPGADNDLGADSVPEGDTGAAAAHEGDIVGRGEDTGYEGEDSHHHHHRRSIPGWT